MICSGETNNTKICLVLLFVYYSTKNNNKQDDNIDKFFIANLYTYYTVYGEIKMKTLYLDIKPWQSQSGVVAIYTKVF